MEFPETGNLRKAMRLVSIALLLLSLPVSAQPARPEAHPEATTCLVTLTGAPDEIREIVEAWLQAEPRCGAALEVTILPVEGGYLLDALDARGGRRVRVAPDAQIAAALIASWAADGSIVLPVPGDGLAAPPEPMVVLPPAATRPSPEPEPLRDLDHRVLVGALVGFAQGLRGEIDLVALHHVSLGVALAARTGTARIHGVERDVAAGGYLGLSFAAARWQLRVELGAGIQLSDMQMYSTTNQLWASSADRLLATDASVTASREVAPGWSATGGVLINVLPDPGGSMMARVVPMALLGVSYRL